MKELSTEEKAKRYDEAIERAKRAHNSAKSDKENGVTDKITEYTIQLTETIFPELEESEDEKIRKELLSFCQDRAYYFPHDPKYVNINNWIAWLEKQGEQKSVWHDKNEEPCEDRQVLICLSGNYYVDFYHKKDKRFYMFSKPKHYLHEIEKWAYLDDLLEKQGEQKPADKVEPKFKIGDWIITPKNEVLQITNIEGTSYVFNNESHYWEIYYCDKQCRLWTIEDAKDGEVLWHSNSTSIGIFIFNKIRDNGKVVCYCNYDSEDHFCLGEYHTCCWSNEKYIKPATKEQRDLLFTKMKEAGYEWDADKKELIKL